METFKKVIDLNLNSVMASCTFFQQNLSKNNGSIVIIGSGASFHAVKGNPAYSASKGGLLTLIKTLAEAWARDGIRVNGIAPGPTIKSKRQSIKHFNNQAKSTLLKKPVGLKDICDTVEFLINNNSITGQVVAVDSGQNLTWNIKSGKE